MLDLLHQQQELFLSASLSAISLSYSLAACLLYLCALPGGSQPAALQQQSLLYAVMFVLAAGHIGLLALLARKHFSREIRARAELLRPLFAEAIDSSQLLLALADPDFIPGQGWRPREDEAESPASLLRMREKHSLSRRIMDFLAQPESFASAFERPLPEASMSTIQGSGAVASHLLLGAVLLPAGLTAAAVSPLGPVFVVLAVVLWLILCVYSEYSISRNAWQSALHAALAEVLKPSPMSGSKKPSRRAGPAAKLSLPPPAHPPEPGAGRQSAPGADSRAAASPAARTARRRESEP